MKSVSRGVTPRGLLEKEFARVTLRGTDLVAKSRDFAIRYSLQSTIKI